MVFARGRQSVLVLCVSAMLTGCTAVQEPHEIEDLAVFGNLRTLEIAPVLLAAQQVHSPPIEVRRGGIPNLFGEDSGPNETAGRADVGTHAETQALRYSLRHPDLRIILTVAEGHYRIVARRSAGIARLTDLRGKRIATYEPTSAGYFLHRMLEQAGMTYDDVTVVRAPGLDEVPDLIASGEVDAVAIWEPASERARQALGDDAIEFGGEGVYRELFNLNTTSSALANPEKRAKIVSFVRAIIRATEQIEDDPEIAWPLVAEAGNFALQDVEDAWPHHTFPAALAPDILEVLVGEEAWLAAMESREPRPREELAALIDPSIVEEARRAP